MSRGCKIALGLFFGLALLVVVGLVGAGIWFARELKNPSAGAAIMAYDVPAGYTQMAGWDRGPMSMTILVKEGAPDAGMIIELVQVKGASSDQQLKEMAAQMDASMSGGGPMGGAGGMRNSREVGRKKVKINGQDREMVVMQGETAGGQKMRMGTITFKGNAGGALLLFMAEPSRWDDKIVNDFLASTNKGAAKPAADSKPAPKPKPVPKPKAGS